MAQSWELTRRSVLRAWLLSMLGKRSLAGTPIDLDPVSLSLRGFAPAAAFQRRYRIDATILLFSAPLFTRKAIGGGYATVETSTARNATAVALQFAAGSDPQRAHGLNRFGILREALVNRGDAIELSFAGLMTRAREQSLEQGKRALRAQGSGSAEGVVARGRSLGPAVQSWIDSIELAPDRNWSNLNDTLSEALRHEPQTPARISSPGSAATFLYVMRSAALCREAVVRRQFLHAGKLYWLETHRHPEHPLELSGTIRNLEGARCAEFHTVYAAGDESGIPLRIEYRPRSFLRLTFETELEATQPIPSVFQEESA